MEEKNNVLENKELNFMDGFKYEAKSTTKAFLGNFFSSWLSFGASSESAVKDSDSSLKEQLAKFLSDQKVSIDIKSVCWVFKKLIEQNCVIGEETLKYLCDLCKKENQDKNSVENQENKENNEKGNQNENGVENQLISTLLKTEYVYTDEEDKKQKIRKCVLTDSLFKKAVNLINQKDFDTKENAGCVFQLVGNIIGGFLSQKNKVSYGDILGLIEKFGFDNTLKVLIDFFDKGDLNAVTVKIESLVVDNSINDKFGKMFPAMLTAYQITFKNIQNNKLDSIVLKEFIGYICTFYNDLTCNDQIKNDKDKLKLHRQFIFSILEKTLLKMPEKASDETKKLMALWSKKIKNVIVGGEENNNLEGKNNLDKEKNIIKEENNANKINVIKKPENDNYDFIGTILTKVSSVISELSVGVLFIDKNKNPSVMVTNTKNENITTNFLKTIWGKLEDKEKNHLKVLVLPIVFKMFGKETWKKEILLHGLKIFGLENFDQIDNNKNVNENGKKNLDLIFNYAVNIIDNLPNDNDKNNEKSKKEKISAVSENLKNIIDVLLKTNDNKNLGQIKDSVDSLIDIAFSLPKDLKGKDGKVNFDQIKNFLDGINKDQESKKWDALCAVVKPFLADEEFLEKLVASIFEQKSDKEEPENKEINKKEPENKEINKKEPENKEKKETWKKDILISGLKLFAGKFDQLSKNIKEILPNLVDLVKIFNEKAEKKDDKKAEEIDFAKIKSFLEGIVQDEDKLKALNNLAKLFCSDGSFLTNVANGIFGKDSWKANVLKHGLKLFGQSEVANEKELKLVFEFIIEFMDNLSNKKAPDLGKIKNFLNGIIQDENKLKALNNLAKLFCSDESESFLTNVVDGIFGKDSWKANVLKHGLKLFGQSEVANEKELKLVFEFIIEFMDNLSNKKAPDLGKIKNFLNGIIQDENKLKALNNLAKLFCSDESESFLTNVVDGILGKDSWKANVLKQGLKLFGVRFDNLKDEALKSILESVAGIMACLTDNRKDKKQKISVITEETKKIFGILLVGKNENKNFNGLAQNLIDILLNDDLSQVEMIDKIKDILSVVKSNFVDENNLNVFKCFVKAFLNNGDFLLGIVNGVETLKPVIKNDKVELEGLTDENRDKNWFVPVLDNLGKFLINDIDHSAEFVVHINTILGVYQEFAQAIDIPANAKCCKDAFSKLEENGKEDQLLEDEESSILQKIDAVESVREKYDALQKFFDGKNELVHDKDETKDDFKQVEKLYKNFMQAFNASNIILTEEEQKKFNKFRFTFEINQTNTINSVQEILKTISEILHAIQENKQQKSLMYVKELLKSVFKDGRILKFITASDELKAIHPILSNAFEQLAKLVEIKIDGIEDVNNFNIFISEDISGLLNIYNKFATALDADSKNNPDYQTNIIDSIKDMIKCIRERFMPNGQNSQKAYQELLKAFFSSVKNENKLGLMSSLSNMKSSNQNDPDETNILTFVIDKIDDKAMSESSKRALKKSLSCLMPLIQNSVEKKNFKDKLFQLLDSYKALAKELDRSFNFQAAKDFVGNPNIIDKYNRNENLASAFKNLSKEINETVPDTEKIMHKYKLLRNKIKEIANTGNTSFELTKKQKDIFEEFELDQKKAIPAIQNILKSISNFCPDDEKIKNENDIINRNDIGNKKVISVNNSIVNINTNSKNDALNNGNEKSFNMVLINLLQGGDFLKDIIDGIDSKDNADMSDDLKNYIASLSSPLCKFLISYLGQTKDNPSTITNKFNKIMSKYVEITAEIQADKININNLLKQVVSLLGILENDIIPKGQDMLDNNTQNNTVFEAYKDLCKQIVSNNDIIIKIINETNENLNDEDGKTKKYLNFAKSVVPILTCVTGSIVENASNTDFFSKFVSKFEQVYSVFSTKKSFAVAVKSLFKKKNKILEAGLQPNEDKKDENQIFKSIFYNLEFERPVNQIKNEKIDAIENDNKGGLSDKSVIQVPLNDNIISTFSKTDPAKILDEERKIKYNDNIEKVYLSETLFTKSYRPDQWFLKRWLNKFKDFVQTWFVKKYFNAFKEYVTHATNDDEILTTLGNKIDLTNPMGAYVTFWRITNLLFWRESKWYYPVVVGEIILSLTIFSPFTVIAGLYSLGKYFLTWLSRIFKKNDEPPNPPRKLPPQFDANSPVRTNISIDTGIKGNNEKNEYGKIGVVGQLEKDNYVSTSPNDNEPISLESFN